MNKFCRSLLRVAVVALLVPMPAAWAAENPTLKVIKADSEETAGDGNRGGNAVDGQPLTYWHTEWQSARPPHPHEIVIQLSPPSKIEGLTYLPRQDGSVSGIIKSYQIYVSSDGKQFGKAIKAGEFASNAAQKIAQFEPVMCGFVKLVALSSLNGDPYTTAAEIGVITPGALRGWSARGDAIVPTEKKPFKVPTDPAARKRLFQQVNDYKSLPPEHVHAHPAAADFPGVANADSPHVARVVNVQVRAKATGPNRDDGWQSTGLYANAGEVVTVTPTEALPAGVTLEVQIGCHTDQLLDGWVKEWLRFPSITRSFTLTQQATPVANAFGGPIFVSVIRDEKLAKNSTARIGLRFANAVEAPYFVLGDSKAAHWKTQRLSPAPWAELVGRGAILHVPSSQVRGLNHPTALLEWWDKVITTEDELVGWPARTVQERVVPDRQISAGWMHSGYPFMCQMASAPEITDLAKLRKDGQWGFFHELGHNHQSDDWTFTDQVEVTVNFFSLYCMEHVVEKPPGTGHGAIEGPELFNCLDRRFGKSPSSDAFDQLAPFVVLIRKFGSEPLKKTLVSYQSAPLTKEKTEADRQAEFVRRYSRNANANLGGFFKKMGYNVPKSLHAELKELPPFEYGAWRKEAQ